MDHLLQFHLITYIQFYHPYPLHVLLCYIYMNLLCGLPFFLLLSSSIFKIFSPIYPVSLLFSYSYHLILFSYFPSKLLNLSCSFQLFISNPAPPGPNRNLSIVLLIFIEKDILFLKRHIAHHTTKDTV